MPAGQAGSRGTACTSASAARSAAWRRSGCATCRTRPRVLRQLRCDAVGRGPRRARRPVRLDHLAGGVLMSLSRASTSFTLDGVAARRVWVEADVRSRAPGVHRRRPRRQGGARGARARPRGDHERGLRVPGRPDHHQPRAGLPAQDRARASTSRSRSRSSRRAGSWRADALAARAVVGRAVAQRRRAARSAARWRSPRARARHGIAAPGRPAQPRARGRARRRAGGDRGRGAAGDRRGAARRARAGADPRAGA